MKRTPAHRPWVSESTFLVTLRTISRARMCTTNTCARVRFRSHSGHEISRPCSMTNDPRPLGRNRVHAAVLTVRDSVEPGPPLYGSLVLEPVRKASCPYRRAPQRPPRRFVYILERFVHSAVSINLREKLAAIVGSMLYCELPEETYLCNLLYQRRVWDSAVQTSNNITFTNYFVSKREDCRPFSFYCKCKHARRRSKVLFSKPHILRRILIPLLFIEI